MTQQIIDLTRRLNAQTPIYQDGDFSDPPFRVEHWCDIRSRGFRVSKLHMGAQTGTHIDAPAHLVDGGATIDAVDLGNLIGAYFLVDIDGLDATAARTQAISRFDGQKILLLRGTMPTGQLSEAAIRDLFALACPVWAFATAITIRDQPPLLIHQMIAENGVTLIEEIDHEAARAVTPGGRMIALPLRLEGVSGSPCRVIVIHELEGSG
ncbi:MAG: hypothetical protein GY791_06890 [Alphaproteobacteria bacterium]|nr:hypothetical protein [Alphaproteobacteria bacterium]